MIIVFCSDPLNERAPDSVYEAEVSAAKEAGFVHALVSYEALVYERNPERAVRRVEQRDPSPVLGIYRGWMLTPPLYEELYGALERKGIRLINDPAAYEHCHYLPASYAVVAGHTPRSVWTRLQGAVDIDQIMELLEPFGDSPVIVKDFVKSRKHEWDEACYIPSAADRAAIERVVRRFVELQGDDLSEGLVFREYVEFAPLAVHSRSGMPLTKEFRVFFLDGRPIYTALYWEEGDYSGQTPEVERFLPIARGVQSRFFTMDVAQRRDGRWLIVELGDAQVAGLPDRADPIEFYAALKGDPISLQC
jgi:hypothetical protein